MSAELFVEPRTPAMSWDQFRASKPTGSIALDGYVDGAPAYDQTGPYLNADHHAGVLREATLSSAQQIARYARLGLKDAFTDATGKYRPKVYVNDCDEDVAAAWYLLDNIDDAADPDNAALDGFVDAAGIMDVSAGTYPVSKAALGEQAWVYKAYREFRASGEMAAKDPEAYRQIIETTAGNIAELLAWKRQQADTTSVNPDMYIEPDLRYNTIGGGTSWNMIEEVGAEGRIGAFRDGTRAYVIARAERGGRWVYTVGKQSIFVPFDVPGVLGALNEAEGSDEDDRWGGSSIVGGSPRVSGSRLQPDEVETVVRRHIATAPTVPDGLMIPTLDGWQDARYATSARP